MSQFQILMDAMSGASPAGPVPLELWGFNDITPPTILKYTGIGTTNLATGALTASGTFNVAGCIEGAGQISFDGINDVCQSVSAINLSSYYSLTFAFILRMNVTVNNSKSIVELGTSPAAVDIDGFFASTSGTTALIVGLKGDVGLNFNTYALPANNTDAIFVHCALDKSVVGRDLILVYFNGVLQTPTLTTGNFDNTNTFGSTKKLNICCRNNSSGFVNGIIGPVGIWAGVLSAAQIAVHIVAGAFPDPTTNTTTAYTANDVWYNAGGQSGVVPMDSIPEILLRTNARQVQLVVTTNAQANNAGIAEFGLVVNGVVKTPVSCTANGSQTLTFTIGNSVTTLQTRDVRLVGGPQLLFGTSQVQYTIPDLTNTTITVVGGTASIVAKPTSRRSILFDVNSIGNGISSGLQEATTGFIEYGRRTYGWYGIIRGWGSKTWYFNCGAGLGAGVMDTVRTDAYADYLCSADPAAFVFETGVNDALLTSGLWSVTNFIAMYSRVLTRIRSRKPNVPIFVIGMFALGATQEATVNQYGNIVQDYRDGLQTMVTTLAPTLGPLFYINGKVIINPATDLSADNIHPNPAGHVKIADALFPILYTLPLTRNYFDRIYSRAF